MVDWKTPLLLLEGDVVNLPALKNHFSRDIYIRDDTPIFMFNSQDPVKTT